MACCSNISDHRRPLSSINFIRVSLSLDSKDNTKIKRENLTLFNKEKDTAVSYFVIMQISLARLSLFSLSFHIQ